MTILTKQIKEAKKDFEYFHGLCVKETAQGGVTLVTHGKRCDAIGKQEALELAEKKIEKLKEDFNKKLEVYDMRLTNDEKSIWLRIHEKRRLIDCLFEGEEDEEIKALTGSVEK